MVGRCLRSPWAAHWNGRRLPLVCGCLGAPPLVPVPLGGSTLCLAYRIFPGHATRHATGGSGSTYIYGFCDKHWKHGMTEAECRSFVTRAVALAMGRDGSSGGCIRLAIIDKDGVRREFIPNTLVPLFEGATGEIPPPTPVAV